MKIFGCSDEGLDPKSFSAMFLLAGIFTGIAAPGKNQSARTTFVRFFWAVVILALLSVPTDDRVEAVYLSLPIHNGPAWFIAVSILIFHLVYYAFGFQDSSSEGTGTPDRAPGSAHAKEESKETSDKKGAISGKGNASKKAAEPEEDDAAIYGEHFHGKESALCWMRSLGLEKVEYEKDLSAYMSELDQNLVIKEVKVSVANKPFVWAALRFFTRFVPKTIESDFIDEGGKLRVTSPFFGDEGHRAVKFVYQDVFYTAKMTYRVGRSMETTEDYTVHMDSPIWLEKQKFIGNVHISISPPLLVSTFLGATNKAKPCTFCT